MNFLFLIQNPYFIIAFFSFFLSFLLCLTRNQIAYFNLYIKQYPNKKIQPFIYKKTLLLREKGYKEFFSFSHLFFESMSIAYAWITLSLLQPSFLLRFLILISLVIGLFLSHYILTVIISQMFFKTLPYFTLPFFSVCWFLFGWFGKLLYYTKTFILKTKFSNKTPYLVLSNENLHILETKEKDILQKNQVHFIRNIINLKSLKIKDILTPRSDIIAISIHSNYNQVLEIIEKNNYSRIPVYQDNLDNIKGVLIATNLINLKDTGTNFLKKVIRKPFFIPNSKKITPLLENFKEKRHHMAIVVDEYGGTEGIVTLDDILEEIVGEIYDENDVREDSIQKIKHNQYLINPILTINEINQFFGFKIPIQDKIKAYTLAGFIQFLAGKIPTEKQIFSFKNIQFQVVKMEQQSIDKILMTIS